MIPLDAREVKQRAGFLAIVSRYTRLRRAGRQYVGLCPFHWERHPSFYVEPERKIWKCFGCGAGGDLFNFVMRAENCDFCRALEIVAGWSAVETRELGGNGRGAGSILLRLPCAEPYAVTAKRIVASLPALGFLPSCSGCGGSMIFRVYQNNRFGGQYHCPKCSWFFGPRELREKLLRDRGGACQWCGVLAHLQMHHLQKCGDQYDPNAIVLLCFGCHDNIQKLRVLHVAFLERRSRKAPSEAKEPSPIIVRNAEPSRFFNALRSAEPELPGGCEAERAAIYTSANNSGKGRDGGC